MVGIALEALGTTTQYRAPENMHGDCGYCVSMRRPTNFPTSLNNKVISHAIWILFRRSPS